jgi:hypothetical protein
MTAFFAGLLVAGMSAFASARVISLEECTEGGEFIKHAAMSRDAGITREFFMNRLQEDILLIQAFPRHLRWFVQEESDERLLTAAAARVFDEPLAPQEHETAFIEECLGVSRARRPDRPI